MWRKVIHVIYKWQGTDRGVTGQSSHPAPKTRLHTSSSWAGPHFWRDVNTSDTGVVLSRHTEVAFGSRVEAQGLLLKLPGLVWWEDISEQGNHQQTRHMLMRWCLWVFYMPQMFLIFLSLSVLHICNLVKSITEDETCTTQNYLWSAKSWVRVLHSLMPSDLHESLPINTACTPNSSLPAFLSTWVQHLPSTWGCSLEPPPWPTRQQLRSAHYTWSLQMESLQPGLVKHRKLVWHFKLIPVKQGSQQY